MIVRTLALSALLAGAALAADPAGIHRTPLQSVPFPGQGYHTVTVRTLIDEGSVVAPHTHPGLEIGYVVSGQATVAVAGRPSAVLASGDSFAVPASTVHSVTNAGAVPLTIVSTYVVKDGLPLASPASSPN